MIKSSSFRISPEIRPLLKKALHEDLGSGDVTTETLVPKGKRGEAVIWAKESGIFCGGPVAREIFRIRDRSLRVTLHVREGGRVKGGEKVVTIRGRVRSILEAERVALNFLGHLSGIATLTRDFVEKVKRTRAQIFDTRKTTPLWRELEKYAVRTGGGRNHRFGLWDEILVKENHLAVILKDAAAASSLRGRRRRPKQSTGSSLRGHEVPEAIYELVDCFAPLRGARNDGGGISLARLLAKTRKRSGIPIEVEVRNLKELAHLLEGNFVPDRILLDNFSLRGLRRAVLFVRGLDHVLRTRYGIQRRAPLLEASGGVTLANVRAAAQTGVERISVGRLTHSAPNLDFSLNLSEVSN